jgi:hypothetical protein
MRVPGEGVKHRAAAAPDNDVDDLLPLSIPTTATTTTTVAEAASAYVTIRVKSAG